MVAVWAQLVAGCEPTPPARLDLDVSQPMDIQAASPEPPGLVAAWSFDEAGGLLVSSSSGSCGQRCTAVIHGLPAATDSWRTNGSGSGWRPDGTTEDQVVLMLDGVDDHMTIAGADTVLADWAAFTLEVRMRARPFSRGDAGGIATLGSDGGAQGFALLLDDEGFLGAQIPGCGEYVSGTDARVPVDSWAVVALTVDPDEGARLVLDGRPVGFCATPATSAAEQAVLTFGTLLTNGSTTRSLCADIDRIRLFDHALPLATLEAEIETYPVGRGAPSAIDSPCSAPNAGCAAGPSAGLTTLAGIAACAASASANNWGPKLDEICAEGWQVCSVAELAALTPSRDLEALIGGGRFALSQGGCGMALGERWTAVSTSCGDQPAPCSSAATAAPLVAEAGFGHHGCTSHAFACGARRCRPATQGEVFDGVLCCMLGCPERSF